VNNLIHKDFLLETLKKAKNSPKWPKNPHMAPYPKNPKMAKNGRRTCPPLTPKKRLFSGFFQFFKIILKFIYKQFYKKINKKL
jgi:hypothetical protein